MFKQVFDTDNLFWRFISRCVDFVGLGLFWLLLCFPIVTIGPSTAALYYTVVKAFRQKETATFRAFWRSFCGNLKKGCIASLICIPFALLFAHFYMVMDLYKGDGYAGAFLFIAYWTILIVPAGTVCWLYPLLASFETLLKGAFRTALILALRHLPSTFIIVQLHLQLIVFSMEQWWPVLFTPVLCTLLSSLFQERVFLKYVSEEEREILEGRYPEDEDPYE